MGGQRRTLPPLVQVAHRSHLSPRFIRRNGAVPVRACLQTLGRVGHSPLHLDLHQVLLLHATIIQRLVRVICEHAILNRAIEGSAASQHFFWFIGYSGVIALDADSPHASLHSLKALKHALIVEG